MKIIEYRNNYLKLEIWGKEIELIEIGTLLKIINTDEYLYPKTCRICRNKIKKESSSSPVLMEDFKKIKIVNKTRKEYDESLEKLHKEMILQKNKRGVKINE